MSIPTLTRFVALVYTAFQTRSVFSTSNSNSKSYYFSTISISAAAPVEFEKTLASRMARAGEEVKALHARCRTNDPKLQELIAQKAKEFNMSDDDFLRYLLAKGYVPYPECG